MNINRNNCEAWFLDYYEGALSAEQVEELFAFLVINPDLEEMFESFEDVSFSPDKNVHFEGKNELKKTSEVSAAVNDQNYEEYFIGSVEGTLSADESKLLEDFLKQNPAKRDELELLRRTILAPDMDEVFDAKASLKKALLVTKENFAEYAVAFIDGELSAEAAQQLELFLASRPEMRKELELFSATKIVPETVQFEDKHSLRKKAVTVSDENFDELAIASVEGLLSAEEKKALEIYVAANASKAEAFALYQQTKVAPDPAVVFDDKASLKRRAGAAIWWSRSTQFAAAAAVTLLIGIFWWNNSNISPVVKDGSTIVNHRPSKNAPVVVDTAAVNNNAPVVTPEERVAYEQKDNQPGPQKNVNDQQYKPEQLPENQSPERLAFQPMSPKQPGQLSPRYSDELQFSGTFYESVGLNPGRQQEGPERISVGQYAMRWMKKKLDRPSESDEQNTLLARDNIRPRHESDEVTGFDLTSSAVNRIGESTGANIRLGKGEEGTVLTIGKYNIQLSRRK